MDEDDEVLLVYASVARQAFTRTALLELMKKARTKNASLGVTGILLHVEDSFFQVLEGRRSAVLQLFAGIERDARHAQVTKLIEEPLPARFFSEWSMGLAEASRLDLLTIPGLNDFFSRATSLSKLGPGRAKTLLEAFRRGQWRRRLRGAG